MRALLLWLDVKSSAGDEREEGLVGQDRIARNPVWARRGAAVEADTVARRADQVLVRRAETGDVEDQVAAAFIEMEQGDRGAVRRERLIGDGDRRGGVAVRVREADLLQPTAEGQPAFLAGPDEEERILR